MIRVSGWRRVPLPPARMTPFRGTARCYGFALELHRPRVTFVTSCAVEERGRPQEGKRCRTPYDTALAAATIALAAALAAAVLAPHGSAGTLAEAR